ncbi:Conjugative transposon protein TraB [Mucinivorans hirudinis]|uniref:Conjugative transposon protein TraB n=1 Tax=Mucinivorans hirudinis TaxID=1433126 RepID=A0A060RA38_9BACT|nr:Conjugative transposon protein TraB [Mucinivorans hirudinis]
MKLKRIFSAKQASPTSETQQNESKSSSYKESFLKEPNVKAKEGKLAYIRKEYHERIQLITSVIGQNDTSIYGFIDNVIEEHFRLHKDEITELYNKHSKSIF